MRESSRIVQNVFLVARVTVGTGEKMKAILRGQIAGICLPRAAERHFPLITATDRRTWNGKCHPMVAREKKRDLPIQSRSLQLSPPQGFRSFKVNLGIRFGTGTASNHS